MPRNPLFNANRLRLGTFCTNTALTLTTAPEVWRPTWPNVLRAGQLADRAGFEAIVPIARWKGYVDGEIEHQTNDVMEVFTFAAAMAQATQHAAIFATSHAAIMHPLVVAKQAATIDNISGGRFALNVVGGWNRREFEMFGIQLLEHSARYAYLREWLQIIRALWTGAEELDWRSEHFTMSKALVRPKPIQQPGPPVMNAGLSSAGMTFAAENSDIAFIAITHDDPAVWRKQVADYKALAVQAGRPNLQVWTNVQIVQAATDAEAEAKREYFADTHRDHAAVDGFLTTIMAESKVSEQPGMLERMRSRLATGTGYPLVGTADTIAQGLGRIAEAGVDGVLIGFANFLDEDGLPSFIEEVLPRLERVGLRAPFAPRAER